MAHQLWTSLTTGHRRIGTRQSEIRALFESGITVGAVFEPLKSCPASADARDMQRLLTERDFDLAGVREDEGGDVVGYVESTSLQHGKVRDHLVPFGIDVLIADSAPLTALFDVLRDRTQVFVLVATKVSGIATQADLNKPAVRIYLFSLVSLLEMHLSFWIRSQYGGEEWKKELSEQRLQATVDRYEERRRKNQEIDMLDCTQFADKRDLLLKSEELREKLHLESRRRGETFFKRAEDLRNSLAHSQQDITEGSTWDAVIDTVDWLERILSRSDELVEERASTDANRFDETLW